MFKYITIATLASTTLLAGCSTPTTVLPMEDNSYAVIANADNATTAERAAMEKANEICTEKGKEAKVIDLKTKYQGIPKDQKAMIGLADFVATSVANHHHHDNMSSGPSASSSDDYKVTIRFRCQ